MKERPILFSAPMVRALLEGRKTQTRRIVKGAALEWLAPGMFTCECVASPENHLCPHGRPGDRLWVKETWQVFRPGSETPILGRMKEQPGGIVCMSYAASEDERVAEYPHAKRFNGPWRPSIFMPRWASRILLEITDIRVERLQDISEEDAIAEGVQITDEWTGCAEDLNGSHVQAYRHLWESINGAGSWDANPWVWVVEFKRIES
ncbi:hypothetical protein [Nitrosovibrio sp. Nv4]|uniref:hypothetical protein n=1 Tax=Nitrosovibrio sp. Nv4 TaxID=1945880 RepID=UPI000BCA7A62|nr:hypothetical protein [Nitrosovibrio sp. Nv4]SOD42428.1 hypothetical protein SAMN06298226_2767 [Nitrosovibrio sp. Nv4]